MSATPSSTPTNNSNNNNRNILVYVLLIGVIVYLVLFPNNQSSIGSSSSTITVTDSSSSSQSDEKRVDFETFSSPSTSISSDTTPLVSIYDLVSYFLSESVASHWKNVFNIDILQQHNSGSKKLYDESTLPCYNEMKNTPWDMTTGLFKPNTPFVAPSCMADVDVYTRTIQYSISIGLSRIAHDKGLNEMYLRIQQQDGGMSATATTTTTSNNKIMMLENFEMKVAQMMISHLQAASIAIQTWIDSYHPRYSNPEGVQTLLSKLKVSYAPSSNNMMNDKGVFRQKKASRWLYKRSSLVRIHHDVALAWNKQAPVNGRFWNNVRPTLACTSLQRSCENPEGCRHLCNFEYSLEKASMALKGSKSGPTTEKLLSRYLSGKATRQDAEGYVMVGFGSNNEFDWEDSMIEDFDVFGTGSGNKNNNRDSSVAPALKSITTFDCTLLTRRNPGVRPSDTVKKIGDRFRFGPFCLNGGQADAVVNFGNTQKLPAGAPSFAEIFESSEASSKSTTLAELRMIMDWKDKRTTPKEQSTKIHLLKMDIESFEYPTLSRWLELDLYQIRKQQIKNSKRNKHNVSTSSSSSSSSASSFIDFQTGPFLEVEQLQIELHRRGHTKEMFAGPIGAMWMMWLQMSMYSLGFMPVVAEKNHYDNCCFEQVLVHYRFFVESELLMPLVV